MRRILCALVLCISASGASQALASDAAVANGPHVIVPVHDIERGEIIADSDFVDQTIAPERMRPGTVTAFSQVAGREARRLLHAGEPVRSDDVRMPILVAKGATVTMTFSAPGISLTATGRAMSEGGLGEAVVVENPISFRQVSCVVTGTGTVRAGDVIPASGAQVAANP
jgi:flagella basal body P-ring formation protein FlgA